MILADNMSILSANLCNLKFKIEKLCKNYKILSLIEKSDTILKEEKNHYRLQILELDK